LYWKDKKAGGILIETTNHKQKRFAIVGIGININQVQFDESLKNPVSLKQITGKHFNVVELAKELCGGVDKWYNVLLKSDTHTLLKTYNTYLYKKNELVTLKKGNIKFNCIVKDVNSLGELQVDNGLNDSFKFGEIEWIV
jgi:BirA family biotin operon repressor/biotin-[acetyl-CoA-carboxylase] ligase